MLSDHDRWTLVTLLGVLLLASPAVLVPLEFGEATNRYEAAYVERTDDGYAYGGTPVGRFDRDVLCWPVRSRVCNLERSLLLANVSLESEVGTGSVETVPDYRYVHYDGAFYVPVAGDGTLSLRPAEADEPLRDVDSPLDTVPSAVRDDLVDGDDAVTTGADLPTHELLLVERGRWASLEYDGSDRDRLAGWLHALDPYLGPAAFLAGLALVLVGQRRRTLALAA